MNKYIVSAALLCVFSIQVMSQSGTNSPYSQYGLGVLSDQAQGFNRGMNGLALGFRGGNKVNTMNPASYSAADSLTMIFDVGLSAQITNFKEGNKKINANTANFEYAVAMFRAMPKMGVSLGILPFTNIGYSYHTTTSQGTTVPGTTAYSSTETYTGSGGVQQAFIGVGYEVFKNFSVGVNAAYLWGHYDKSVTISNSDNYVNTIRRQYEATVNSYKLDFGVQYLQLLDKNNSLTLGVTYGLGHKLSANPSATMTSNNSQTGVSSTISNTITDGLSIPHTFAVGAAWQHKNKLTIGADYSFQKWGDLEYPEIDYSSKENYVLKKGLLDDRHKLTIGGEFVPEEYSTNFFKRTYYRFGASMATPYYKINGHDGPKEYSVSAGLGILIFKNKTRPSMLNISAQWTRMSSTDFITENTFRVNIGLTFNERWFSKWKVE